MVIEGGDPGEADLVEDFDLSVAQPEQLLSFETANPLLCGYGNGAPDKSGT